MSDSSSMMIVMMMGVFGSCALSVVGGVGVWYIKDPTLGGLLPDEEPDDEGEGEGEGEGGGGADGNIPLDTKVYIYGLLEKCDGDHSYTLLYATSSDAVDSACSRKDDMKNQYLWTINTEKSGKWTYYTIKNVGRNKYLTADDAGDSVFGTLSLSDTKTLWRIKAQQDDSSVFSISTKDSVGGSKRYLNFRSQKCSKQDPGSRRIHTHQGDVTSWDKVSFASHFKFRKASSGWKGAVKNPC